MKKILAMFVAFAGLGNMRASAAAFEVLKAEAAPLVAGPSDDAVISQSKATTMERKPGKSDKKITVKTVVTCQQEEGDQWIEVGIARTKGYKPYKAYIIAHNADNNSAKLKGTFDVSCLQQDGRQVYMDPDGDAVKLSVYRDGAGVLRGDLVSGAISKTGLICYENSEVVFDEEWYLILEAQ